MTRTVSGNFTADGTSSPLVISSPNFETMNGAMVWLGSGSNVDFGGGTVTIQMKNVDGNFVDIPLASYIATACEQVFIPNNSVIRISLSGSASPNLDYQLSMMSCK